MAATILFVEDNEDLRENAALVLGLEGYQVQLARDGREALDFLENGLKPDLIVSDIMMPRMDGYQFFEEVRKKPQFKIVPFIFLTARSSRQDISAGRYLGVDDYLVKPFEPKDFLQAVHNKLQKIQDIRDEAARNLEFARQALIQLLSHELRTPLTYVMGGFALLAEELESEKTGNNREDVSVSLGLIQSGTNRLNRLAEQMVLYSQLISGFVAQQVREISEYLELDYLLSDAQSLLSDYARDRRINFRRFCPKGVSMGIYGVKDLLVTALTEVLRNAIQYSHEAGKVDLSLDQDGEWVTLTVTDRGVGIAEENLETIWQVMIQSDRERTEQQGVGMGLPVAKGIINAHGGTIVLDSVLGEGTTVTIRLPYVPEEPFES
jgi:signal transduction histidine kinase